MSFQMLLALSVLAVQLQLNILLKPFAVAAKWDTQVLNRNANFDAEKSKETPAPARYFLQLLATSKGKDGKRHSFISLHCKLRGKRRPIVKFKWEKDGLPLVVSSRRFIKTRLRSERLKLKPIRAIDSGRYRCSTVVNGMVIQSKLIKIYVHDGTI